MALIATEWVSIALLWLLLPPEVGVNRHDWGSRRVGETMDGGQVTCTPGNKSSSEHIWYICASKIFGDSVFVS